MAGVLPSEDTLVRGRFLNGVTAAQTAPHSLSGYRLPASPWFVPTPWPSCWSLSCFACFFAFSVPRRCVGRAGAAEKASGESLRLPRPSGESVTVTHTAGSGVVSGRYFGVGDVKWGTASGGRGGSDSHRLAGSPLLFRCCSFVLGHPYLGLPGRCWTAGAEGPLWHSNLVLPRRCWSCPG